MDLKIKIPKPKKVYKKGSSTINPNLYWNWVLLVALIMILFVFAYGYLSFRKVSRDPSLSEEAMSGQMRAISKNRIDKALEYFEAREARSTEIINSPTPVIDPSL